MQADIISRPAATPRSPNRKPRTRGPAHADDLAFKKERIINLTALGKSYEAAGKRVGISESGIKKLVAKDPEFESKMKEARAEARKTLAEGRAEAKQEAKEKLETALLEKGEKAVGNFDDFLVSESEKLRLEASQDVLDRIGVGVEKKGDKDVKLTGKLELTLKVKYDDDDRDTGINYPPETPTLLPG